MTKRACRLCLTPPPSVRLPRFSVLVPCCPHLPRIPAHLFIDLGDVHLLVQRISLVAHRSRDPGRRVHEPSRLPSLVSPFQPAASRCTAPPHPNVGQEAGPPSWQGGSSCSRPHSPREDNEAETRADIYRLKHDGTHKDLRTSGTIIAGHIL